jgi:hypothetical protein
MYTLVLDRDARRKKEPEKVITDHSISSEEAAKARCCYGLRSWRGRLFRKTVWFLEGDTLSTVTLVTVFCPSDTRLHLKTNLNSSFHVSCKYRTVVTVIRASSSFFMELATQLHQKQDIVISGQ